MSILTVENLRKVYSTRFGGNQVEALKNVNFSVDEGEYVAIMGESGSGKTTLLNLLAALDKPTGGTVVLDGKELGRIMGFRMIAELTPEKHDEMIGFLSQLAHCIAVSLMVCKDSHHLVDYTGDSFRDLTRIAKINDEMWSELFLLNRDELVRQMDLFSEKFELLRNSIANGDRETIRRMMRLSTERRKYFDVKKEDDES